MVIAFCGHSDYRATLEDEQKICSILEEKVGNAPAELYFGGYGAFDSFALKCGKKFQKTHPNIKLVFITPYINRSAASELYDETLYPELENTPPRFAISHRNKWMIERADFVVAYIEHAFGGAFQTYRHARRKRKPVLNLTSQDF